jgi:4-hydroxybenzoate polyprenyltransferase
VAGRQHLSVLASWYVAATKIGFAAVALTNHPAWGYLLGQRDAGIELVRVAAHLGVFLFGSTLLHSAGCVINDIQDKDLDAQVGAHSYHLFILDEALT